MMPVKQVGKWESGNNPTARESAPPRSRNPTLSPTNYRLDQTPEKLNLPHHLGNRPGVAFSPDGRLVATVGLNPPVRVCDAATRREIWRSETVPINSRFRRTAVAPVSICHCTGQRLAHMWWQTASRKSKCAGREFETGATPILRCCQAHRARF